jgi:hypothetical protein
MASELCGNSSVGCRGPAIKQADLDCYECRVRFGGCWSSGPIDVDQCSPPKIWKKAVFLECVLSI